MEENIFVSVITVLVLEGCKRLRAIPINAGQMGRIRIAVAVISFIGSVGFSYLNGTEPDKETIQIFADTFVNYVMSSGMYAGIIKTRS